MSLIPPPQCIRDAMNADVVVHPSAVASGLENARNIIMAKPGTHSREMVRESAQTLYDYGDFMDHVRGAMVLDRMDGEDRDFEIEESDRSRAARKALTRRRLCLADWAVIFAAAFALACLALVVMQ